MKNITLISFLFVAAFGFSQTRTVAIASINGMTQADFIAAGKTLTVGTDYEFVIDFTNQETTANALFVKTLTPGTFATMEEASSAPITTADGQMTVTFTPTMAAPDVILQVRSTTTKFDGTEGPNENIFIFNAVVQTSALSVDSFNRNKLSSFFYNPQSNIITFGEDVISKSYAIYSLTGKSVINQEATGQIDVASLSKGMYIVVTDEGVGKFAKY